METLPIFSVNRKTRNNEHEFFTKVARFRKYDGITIGDNSYHLLRVLCYSESMNNLVYNDLFIMNNVDYLKPLAEREPYIYVKYTKEKTFDFFILDEGDYFYLVVKPYASGQFLYTQLLFSSNSGFIEGLDYQPYNITKVNNDISILPYDDRVEKTTTQITTQSGTGFSKFAELTLSFINNGIYVFKIVENGNGSDRLVYGDVILKAFRGSTGSFTTVLTTGGISSDFTSANINIGIQVSDDTISLYAETKTGFSLEIQNALSNFSDSGSLTMIDQPTLKTGVTLDKTLF